jgi:hypothetical protein
LPENAELAAQYLLLYELSVPFGSDLNNLIDVGKTATRMTVTMHRLSSEQQRKLDARGQDWLRANAPELATGASGISLIFAYSPYGTSRACCGARPAPWPSSRCS